MGRTTAEDPLMVYTFVIEIEGFKRFGFSKCSRLAAETAKTEYREGGDNATAKKIPGLTTFPDITLERGQTINTPNAGGTDVLDWYQLVFDVAAKKPISSGNFRREIDIVQFDKEGNEAYRWRLTNAWPTQIQPNGDLDAMSSDVSIETMTICYEGFRLVT